MQQNKVLVVDDVRLTAELARAMLEIGGIEAAVVHSGAAALEWLVSNPVEVIVSDWSMPGMSGAQLAQSLRSKYSGGESAGQCPWLVAYTAYSEEAERASILGAGFDDVVQKPARADVLIETVKRWLERPRTA